MNFIFTVALNNTSTPTNYKSILTMFNSLAASLKELGHNTHILCNPLTYKPKEDKSGHTEVSEFTDDNYDEIISKIDFVPDYAFIWNGNLNSDKATIDVLKSKNIKIVYGELGFFNHFKKTCYFDLTGVNCNSSIITSNIDNIEFNAENLSILNNLYSNNIQPRLYKDPYIFVPLQVETDTQIVNYSPFKTMNDFLEYVNNIFKYDNRTILFKQHPLFKRTLKTYDKFIEVTEDVHHYIPYADIVVGINSTVLTETLLYHTNIITVGAGITARNISENQRKKYVLNIHSRQLNWDDLGDPIKIKNSYFYKELMRIN